MDIIVISKAGYEKGKVGKKGRVICIYGGSGVYYFVLT